MGETETDVKAEAAAWRDVGPRVLGYTRANESTEMHHRFLLWGKSGQGKTAAAVLAAADLDLDLADVFRGEAAPIGDPSIFVLETEKNAIPTIRAVNPLAAYKLCETKAQSWEVIQAAISGELQAAGFKTLVIDGLTELQRQIADSILGAGWQGGELPDSYWNDLTTRTRLMLRTIRSLPITVVATCLEKSKENQKTKAVHVQPQFEGNASADAAMETMAAVGRCTKEGEGDLQRYVVDFKLPARYSVKGAGQVGGRVKPCAAAWIAVLDGKLPPAEIRVARRDPPPETEAPAAEAPTDAKPAPRAVKR